MPRSPTSTTCKPFRFSINDLRQKCPATSG
jgi:hypothetical protein